MSEGLAHDEQPTASSRSRPAYGEGGLAYEPRQEVEEGLERSTHWALAVAIVTPVLVAYGAVVYGVYRAARAIF